MQHYSHGYIMHNYISSKRILLDVVISLTIAYRINSAARAIGKYHTYSGSMEAHAKLKL